MKCLALKKWFLALALIVLVTASLPSFAGANPYSFQEVNYPSDTFTQLLGINNAAVIAGYHGAAANQGFTLTLPNNFTSENFPASAQTQVSGINNLGDTCGFYIDFGGTTHGFLRTSGGTFSTIDAPGTAFNQLLGLNDLGQKAGYSSTDATGATLQLAFTSQGGVFTYLTPYFPVVPLNNQATDINNSSMVSGFYVDSGGVTHGFLLNGATLTPLDFPGSKSTKALGLNNKGQVVGVYNDSAGNNHGFVYNGVFQSVDEPNGIGTTTINGINDLGQIVGFFVDAHGNTVGFVGAPGNITGTLSILLLE